MGNLSTHVWSRTCIANVLPKIQPRDNEAKRPAESFHRWRIMSQSAAAEEANETIPKPGVVQKGEGKPESVVATNDGVDVCGLTSVQWLEKSERGAYTTARTVGGGHVFELSFHIKRLVDSLKLMGSEPLDEQKLVDQIRASIRGGVKGFREIVSVEGDCPELKITVLVSVHNGIPKVTTHVTRLGARARHPVKVMIHGAPRENAAAKDSEWVRKRKTLVDEKPDDVNEVVLVGDGGALFEGLSSNFFALKNGTIYTAGEGILFGSVREAVLRAADRLGVPVVLKPPHISDVEAWEGAFVSSTSRLLLPVDEISLPDEDPPQNIKYHRSTLVEQLENAVMEDVQSCSEPIL